MIKKQLRCCPDPEESSTIFSIPQYIPSYSSNPPVKAGSGVTIVFGYDCVLAEVIDSVRIGFRD